MAVDNYTGWELNNFLRNEQIQSMLNHCECLTLIVLASFGKLNDEFVYPTLDKLSKILKINKRSVGINLKNLAEKGFIDYQIKKFNGKIEIKLKNWKDLISNTIYDKVDKQDNDNIVELKSFDKKKRFNIDSYFERVFVIIRKQNNYKTLKRNFDEKYHKGMKHLLRSLKSESISIEDYTNAFVKNKLSKVSFNWGIFCSDSMIREILTIINKSEGQGENLNIEQLMKESIERGNAKEREKQNKRKS